MRNSRKVASSGRAGHEGMKTGRRADEEVMGRGSDRVCASVWFQDCEPRLMSSECRWVERCGDDLVEEKVMVVVVVAVGWLGVGGGGVGKVAFQLLLVSPRATKS